MVGISRNQFALAAAAAAILLAAGVVIVLHAASQPAPKHFARTRPPVQARALSTPTPSPAAPAPLARATTAPRLQIPSIHVDAVIENVGVDANGNMAVPKSPWDVGWYDLGPQPGDPGDAVIDGHLDWYTTGPAVFWNLGKLHVGDRVIVIRRDGKKITFVVDAVNVYPYNAHPIGLFSSSGPPEISMITCSGQWDAAHQNYQQRLVVNAHPLPTS